MRQRQRDTTRDGGTKREARSEREERDRARDLEKERERESCLKRSRKPVREGDSEDLLLGSPIHCRTD